MDSRSYLEKEAMFSKDKNNLNETMNTFILMNIFLWILQRTGILGDRDFLLKKFKEITTKKETKKGDVFSNFFMFLKHLFDDMMEKNNGFFNERSLKVLKFLTIPVVAPVARCFENLFVPDQCFFSPEINITRENLIEKHDQLPLYNLFLMYEKEGLVFNEELLDQVAQKMMILERRKKSGSFYTPTIIAKYMSKHSLEEHLLFRINKMLDLNFDSIDDLMQAMDSKMLKLMFTELQNLKILDMAVGSGIFLIEMAQELLKIYNLLINIAQKKELEFESILLDHLNHQENQLSDEIFLKLEENSQLINIILLLRIIYPKNLYGVDLFKQAVFVARVRLILFLINQLKNHALNDQFMTSLFSRIKLNVMDGNSLLGFAREEELKNLFKSILDTKELLNEMNILDNEDMEHINDKQWIFSASNETVSDAAIIHLQDIYKGITKMVRDKRVSFPEVKRMLVSMARLQENTTEKYASIVFKKHLEKAFQVLSKILDLLFLQGLLLKNVKKDLLNHRILNRELFLFHWILEFGNVIFNHDGFDMIIGNPPYGRFKDIVKDTREKKLLLEIMNKLFNHQEGNLNLYKLFLEKAWALLDKDGILVQIFPSSFLGERASRKLRKLFFDKGQVLKILEFPERTRVFKENVQSTCIFSCRKTVKKDYMIKFRTGILRKELENLETLKLHEISKKELKLLSGPEYRFPLISRNQDEILVLKKLAKYPPFKGDGKTIPPVGVIGEGPLHETAHSEFIGFNSGDELLVKGIHVDRFFVDLSPHGPKPRWIKNKNGFFNKKKTALKTTLRWRIIGRNTQNKASKHRLRFALLPPGPVITNSLKHIIIQDENIDKFYLLALLNSRILNWRFEVFSSQNNIRNYDIEELPIPRVSPEEQLPFKKLSKILIFLKRFIKDDNAKKKKKYSTVQLINIYKDLDRC